MQNYTPFYTQYFPLDGSIAFRVPLWRGRNKKED